MSASRTATDDYRPLVAMTLGDPAGIGPEILLKSLVNPLWHGKIRPLVIGDRGVVDAVLNGCGLDLELRTVTEDTLSDDPDLSTVQFLDCHSLDREPAYGEVLAEHGAAAVAYIEKACNLALTGTIDSMVTGPISKDAIWKAGSTHLGHTEMITELLGVKSPEKVMTMFYLKNYKIFFLTRHLSLARAIESFTTEKTVEALKLTHQYMRMLGWESPRIALPALNPHAGENGHLGTEERDIFEPAVARARDLGIDVQGPIPADAVFYQANEGRYDAVLSLFHDQGHIAAKTVDFFGTITCQLGLPLIRTSVDHGTAFDIAGRWIADPGAQEVALEAAVTLTRKSLSARTSA